ncbi:hypothetical protein [uncultured Gammaproteobacteria bacterium]|nr:hypothetical protein [uncultured Gammaproteobacteria bacterium]
MSRRTTSFSQLVDYMSDIDKADQQYSIYHNLFTQSQDKIADEFFANSKFVRKRKNGVYLYHEILSITKNSNLNSAKQKQILQQIARQYIQQRANENLVYATMHDDHDNHLHYHFIISSNKAGESTKTRMSKYDFDKFKKDLELKVLKDYPELNQTLTINKQAGEKLSNKASETKRRMGKTPKRDEVKAKLQSIFAKANSKDEFLKILKDNNFDFYIRGKNTMGVLDTQDNKKYRLKTLGILGDFEQVLARIELSEVNVKQSEQAKNYKQNTKNTDDVKVKAISNQLKIKAMKKENKILKTLENLNLIQNPLAKATSQNDI